MAISRNCSSEEFSCTSKIEFAVVIVFFLCRTREPVFSGSLVELRCFTLHMYDKMGLSITTLIVAINKFISYRAEQDNTKSMENTHEH